MHSLLSNEVSLYLSSPIHADTLFSMPAKQLLIACVFKLFVSPGAGHLFLKKKKIGYTIITITTICLTVLILFLAQFTISQLEQYRHAVNGIFQVSQKITENLWSESGPGLHYSLYALVIIYFVTCLDLIRLFISKK